MRDVDKIVRPLFDAWLMAGMGVVFGGEGAGPTELAQRLHDNGIDRALANTVTRLHSRRIVGIMGGHASPRGSGPYELAARLAQQLTRAGVVIATGGGPGAAMKLEIPISLSAFVPR